MSGKIKLPRKRKKVYVKERGRLNYHGVIKLHQAGMFDFLDEEKETKKHFARDVSMGMDIALGKPDFKILSYY